MIRLHSHGTRIARALATLLAVCVLGASSTAFAEDTEPLWSEETGDSGQESLRAPDPNQGPSTEDLAADDYTTDVDSELKSPFTDQPSSVDSRFPKIEAPKHLQKQPPQQIEKTPRSPLVQINKSGLKPQVIKKPTGGGSINGMGITFNTSLQTGAASMSVPMAVPPGRRGMAPSLTLGYSSGGGQGIVGLGWSLGAGFIARQTDQGLPRYNQYDRFVYNGGQELVRVDSFGGQPPDSVANAQGVTEVWIYRAKIEGIFWRFFRVNPGQTAGEYWVAQDRNGTLYYFGDSANALIQDAGGQHIFRWNITHVQDVHGNQISYTYESFVDSPGQIYLAGISYNNHPTDSTFQHNIELKYGSRNDILTTYQAGFPVTTSKRLVSVYIWTDYGAIAGANTPSGRYTDPNSSLWLVRRYALEYRQDRYHSLLDSVTLFGANNTTSLPPARFHYQEVNDQDGTTTTVAVPDFGELNTEVRNLMTSPNGSVGTGLTEIMDLDGDGLVDVLLVDPTTFADDYHRYQLGYGNVDADGFIMPGLDPLQVVEMGTAGDIPSRGDHLRLSNSNVRIMDVDGDGNVEMIHMPRMGTYNIYRLACDETQSPAPGAPYNAAKCQWQKSSDIVGHPDIDLTIDAEEIRLVDVNGDHLTDVVRTAGTRIEHWLNLGRYQGGEGKFGHVLPDGNLSDDPVTSCPLFKGSFIRFSDPRIKLADMNGDGLQDIVLVDFGQVAYWPNKGWGQWGLGTHCDENMIGSGRHVSMSNVPFMAGFDANEVRLGDVNGDGLADIIRVRNLVVDVWINRGDSFAPRVMIDPAPFSTGFSDRVRLADVNASGSRDIVWGDAGNYSYIDLTGGIKPRLLVKMENGLGATTEVEYESSIAQYLTSRNEGDEWNSVCPFPNHVVRKVTTRDNFGDTTNGTGGWNAGVYESKYRYYDCHWDGKEHEFRGFGETIVESVGDTNSPTSYTRHRFHQGDRTDESLAGSAYRVDTYAYDQSQQPVFLGTKYVAFAVRTVDDQPHIDDAEPGLDPFYERSVRFSYAAQNHSFGYNTTNWQPGPHIVENLLAVRYESTGGAVDSQTLADVSLPATESIIVHTKSDVQVDDLRQVTQSRAFGQVNKTGPVPDPIIESHSTYVHEDQLWIHRVCETWVQEGNDIYQRKLESYDNQGSEWGANECTAAGSATCQIIDKGLSTKGEYEQCYWGDNGLERLVIEEHLTEYSDFGLPRHTRALKKMEGWVYYEDPRGYQALPTREVLRVGTAAATDDYINTPVKYLTTRASYDPGFGIVTEYQDENSQRILAVYDAFGRPTEMWGPREPRSTNCPNGGNPTLMKVAQIEYHVTTDPVVQPYSYVKATSFQDACDLSNIREAWSYVDGMSRPRITISEADEENPVPPRQRWIATGSARFNKKGVVRQTYEPAYTDFPTQPSLPAPTADDCPNTDPVAVDSVCVSTTTYDAFGRAIETQAPNGDTARVEYHGPLELWTFDGNDNDQGSHFYNTPTKMYADGHGRVLEVEQLYRDSQGGDPRSYYTSYVHSPVGSLKAIQTCTTGERYGDCTGIPIEKRQFFDSLGQRREIQDPDAGTWKFVYNESGNLIESTDGKWNNTTDTYPGNKIGYQYDAANRLIVEKCISCEGKADNTLLSRYYYDSPATMRSGRGYMNLSADPALDEPQDWVLGRVTRIEDETGVIHMSYDRLGRQVSEAHHIDAVLPDGSNTPITGDQEYYIGRVGYDDTGRVVKQVYPTPAGEDQLTTRYTYTRRGLLASIYQPTDIDPSIPKYEFLRNAHYNALGQRTDYEYSQTSTIKTTKTYDRRRRTFRSEVEQQGLYQYDLLKKRYHYDASSNITHIIDERDFNEVDSYTAGKNRPYDLTIEHDSLYRVTRVVYEPNALENHPTGLRREMRYAYNAVGNLTERSTTDANNTDNPADEFYEKWLGANLSHPTTHPHAFKEAITHRSDGDFRVTADYDTNGNMISLEIQRPGPSAEQPPSFSSFKYTWDHYDRLTSVKKFNVPVLAAVTPSAQAFYVYDSSGQRLAKSELNQASSTAQDTLYIAAGLEARNHAYERYVFDGSRRIARLGVTRPSEGPASGATTLLYVPDHLGSNSVVVMDQSLNSPADIGAVITTTSHLPYGGTEAESGAEVAGIGTDIERFYHFSGKELEREQGIQYFGARYYNPQLGRFLSVDAAALFAESEVSPYLYVGGHVYTMIDPDGNHPEGSEALGFGLWWESPDGIQIPTLPGNKPAPKQKSPAPSNTWNPYVSESNSPAMDTLSRNTLFQRNFESSLATSLLGSKRLKRYFGITPKDRARDKKWIFKIFQAARAASIPGGMWAALVAYSAMENWARTGHPNSNVFMVDPVKLFSEARTGRATKLSASKKWYRFGSRSEAVKLRSGLNNAKTGNTIPMLGKAMRVFCANANVMLQNAVFGKRGPGSSAKGKWNKLRWNEKAAIVFLSRVGNGGKYPISGARLARSAILGSYRGRFFSTISETLSKAQRDVLRDMKTW